jgi:RHS repeat-associated protein
VLGQGDSNSNQSRLTSITYPNGRVVNFNYNNGTDDRISRLSSLSSSGTTLESYSYLGLGTVVKRAHPQPNVDLTYITAGGSGDGGDQYTGLDRFGRVGDQKWYNNGTSTTTDEFKYGYDRDSNRLYRTNEVNHSFDELYHANGSANGYDNLNQLTAFARGTLNAGHDTISSPSHSITWSLDALGNFSSTTTDGGSAVSNTFNKQNEETQAGTANLAFDANGNLTTDDQGHTLVYDAWNRLVAVKNGGTTLVSYKYDALGRKIVENPGTVNDLYYSDQWQVLEERSGGVSTATIQYVWSPVYVDGLIERDRSTQNNGTMDERLYAQQDANWNVTALLSTSGTVVERYVYDPYGKPTFLNASWGTLGGSAYVWRYLHQGGRYDTTSGLYDFRMRHYSPTLGRWVQLDPIRFAAGDPNLYRDEGNNPANATDPSGLADTLHPPPTPPTRIGPSVRGDYPWVRAYTPNGGWTQLAPDEWRGPDGQRWTWHGKHWDVKPAQGGTKVRIDPNGGLWRHGRLGSTSLGPILSMLGTAVIVAGVEYANAVYAETGWASGSALAERIGYGRGLQIAGMLGELPGDEFDIQKWDGTIMHVKIEEQDGQRYFHAWHERSVSHWYCLWLDSSIETVEDIKVGQVPAFHENPHLSDNLFFGPENVDLSGTSFRFEIQKGWARPTGVPGVWELRR